MWTTLKFFGYFTCDYMVGELRNKLDPESEECIFIGYYDNTNAYRLYNLKTYILVLYKDVIFDKEVLYSHWKLYFDDGSSGGSSPSIKYS